jgi:hypothetical protein
MSERERWIIYPLLFFALGAALRDKFTHEVRTDQVIAGRVVCEELLVTDSEKPDRVVAKLTSNPPQRNQPDADRYGVFVLIDSEGKELCGVTNNQLQVNQIACRNVISQAVTVVDPQNPTRALALLTAAEAKQPDESTRRIGSLLLTDSEGQELFGLADDQLKMRQIICEGVTVIDPDNPQRTLAALGSLAAPGDDPKGKPQRFGVLALNNQKFNSLLGNPLREPTKAEEKKKEDAEGKDRESEESEEGQP